MKELYYETIAEIAPKVEKKEISPVELTDVILSRVDQVDKELNSYITVMEEEAKKSAKQAEEEILRGNYRGPLHGIPIGLKDLIYTKGIKTTAGSKVMENFVPDYDATVVTKFQEAGAVIMGKLNTHEFAAGPTNINNHFGNTKNPWDRSRITGGSSGGSGAAVAAGLCYAALGTDTGGSVRIPSALCGITGLKPTYGRVSKYGLVPLATSLDHIGPMTRSVEDLAIVLEAIAGYDAKDPATVKREKQDFRSAINKDIQGLKIGVPTNFYFDFVEKEVEDTVRTAIKLLEELGAEVVEMTIPELSLVAECGLGIIHAEAAAYHHDTFVKSPELYGNDVRRVLEIGENISAVEYIRAQQVQQEIKAGFARIFQDVDVIAAPTVSMTAPKIGEHVIEINGTKNSVVTELVRMNLPANIAGLPAVSVPVGFSSTNLPIGMQLIGRAFAEQTVLNVAAAYEDGAG